MKYLALIAALAATPAMAVEVAFTIPAAPGEAYVYSYSWATGDSVYAYAFAGVAPIGEPFTPPVPEASTYGMMLAGLGLIGFMARRRGKS